MPILGAILAGGQSSRFGSDKCELVIGGRRLIDHTIRALAGQVDAVVICGRSESGYLSLDDRPKRNLGPLGGLNSALRYAADNAFDAVLSTPVDVIPLPEDLARRLGCPRLAHLKTQHAVACWPSSLAEALEVHLASGKRSVMSWIEACRSPAVDDGDLGLFNLNDPTRLDEIVKRFGADPTA
jgi:molybdopterin-guanine dinucleotide biosynthesis protein A